MFTMSDNNFYVLQVFSKQYSNQHTGFPYTRHVMTCSRNKENEAHKKALSRLISNYEEYEGCYYKGDYVCSIHELVEKSLLTDYATQGAVDEHGLRIDDLLLATGIIN